MIKFQHAFDFTATVKTGAHRGILLVDQCLGIVFDDPSP